MRIRKTLVFTLLIIFQVRLIFAEVNRSNFNFEFPSRLLLPGKEYDLNFLYSLSGVSENNFIVVPVSENGTMEIFNETNKLWIKQNDLRSNFPKLKSQVLVKIISFGGLKTKICFEIQLLKTGVIYKTPCKEYWNREYFGKYISALNDRILRWVKEKSN